jgi:putative two-component system response regulator
MREKPLILVADDEDRNIRLIEAMLLPMGYDIAIAQSGRQALEKVKELFPDVILLDIMMPGMDGYEVARRIKKDQYTCIIPIVMVTNLGDVKDRVMALEAGADDFLSKPVDKLELMARVGSLVKVKAYNDHLRNYQEKLESEVNKRTGQLKAALKKIKEASHETIYRLCRAAEYKDDNTAGHLHRVSNYAALLAIKLGLRKKTTESILLAAPMHDVGKIGIPDHILQKPGKLTPDEWEIMKKHTIFGGKILEGSHVGYIRFAKVIALTHHEKWDGSGYPLGLKGDKIPLVGRIMAMADVFDALTSKRPYKKAFSVEKSFEIIKQGRENHFDPDIVDAFFSITDQILDVKEKYTEDEINIMAKPNLFGN